MTTSSADEEINPTDNTEDALLDSLSASLKKLLNKGKSRGYITVDELNGALPPEKESSEQIEDVMAMISDMGINLIENDEAEEDIIAVCGVLLARRKTYIKQNLKLCNVNI